MTEVAKIPKNSSSRGSFMSLNKTGIYMVSVVFSLSVLYICWWLMQEMGEVVAVIVFVLLSVNYFWLMRKLKSSEK